MAEVPLASDAFRLHQKLIRTCHSSYMSALTASIACELVGRDDDRLGVIVCWWIAMKFEEVFHPCITELMDDFRLPFTYSQACEREQVVLVRIVLCVPYKTVIRDMYDRSTTLSACNLRTWSFVLLYSNLYRVHTASEWLDMLEYGGLPPILSLALNMTHPRIKQSIVVPRRITWVVKDRRALKRNRSE